MYDVHSYNHMSDGIVKCLFSILALNVIDMNHGSVLWLSIGVQNWRRLNWENHRKCFGRKRRVLWKGLQPRIHLRQLQEYTLVLATEIKKVYCNELTGDDYP